MREVILPPFSMAEPLPEDSVYVGKSDQQGMLTDQHAQKNRTRVMGCRNHVLWRRIEDPGTLTYRRDCLVGNKAAVYNYSKGCHVEKILNDIWGTPEGETKTSGYSLKENKF